MVRVEFIVFKYATHFWYAIAMENNAENYDGNPREKGDELS
jgi:hypothetical protein